MPNIMLTTATTRKEASTAPRLAKTAFQSLLTALLMIAGFHQSRAQPTNSVYGFYWTAYPAAGCFATNVIGFANVADLIWNKADADQIIACNSKLIINCTPIFYVYGTPGLNPSYQSAWNNLKTQLTPHYLSQIAAFYVMDEPYYNGFTRAQLETAVATIKTDFPNIPVSVTFAYTSLPNFTDSSWIPAGLDWISPDQYGDFNAIPALIATLKTYKRPYQKIFLTTQGWRNNGGNSDATVADWSYDYHDLYLSEPDIFGQLVFLCRGSRELAFPSDGTMPLTYAVQQVIGTEVLKMGNSFKRAFSDMFESAPLWTANWASTGAWARATTRKRPGGSYSAHVVGPVTDSALTSIAIGVSGATKASVNFWWYISGLDSAEYVHCDVKLDDGAWIQRASIDGGGTSGSKWLHVIVSDVDASSATNLYLRFRGTMNSSTENASVDSVNVCKWADPTVTTWPTATAINYGQTLSTSTLTGGSATPTGSFEWAMPWLVPNAAGTTTQSVTFIPNDTANYNRIRGSVSVTMNKATPTVTRLPITTPITYGQTLSNSFLYGGSGTPAGSFSWTTPTLAPNAGTAPQSVTYTPTDTTNYASTNVNVNVTVNPVPSSTTLESLHNPSPRGMSVLFTATVSSSVGTPTGIVEFLTNGTPLANVPLTGGSADVGTADLPVGSVIVEARYSAQTNWLASSQGLNQVVIAPVAQIALSPQDVQVQIQSAVGYTYDLQYSVALDPADWQELGASQAGTGGVLAFTNSSASALPQGFYRLKIY
jgi:hypothetical protein